MKPAEAFLYSVLGGFAVGIALRSAFDIPFLAAVLLLVLSSVCVVSARFVPNRALTYTALALCLASASAGIARYELFDSKQGDALLYEYAGTEARYVGTVVEEADNRSEHTLLTVLVNEMNGTTLSEPTKVLVQVPAYPEYRYGDAVWFTGELEVPKEFQTDTGRTFDYRAYLARERIFFQVFRPELELVSSGGGHWLKRALLDFKSHLLSATAQLIPEPENGLLSGILFGEKRAIPETLVEDFRRAGIVHIIVLSGYNITIIGEYAVKLFALLPAPAALFGPYAGLIAVGLFVLMTGASATAVRSALMASLVLVARVTGRRYDASRALLIVGFLMIAHNPKLLAFDPSFQLSFLATLGLIHASTFSAHFFRFLPERFGVREIAATTIATQLLVTPLLVYLSGTISLLSPFANMLVLPFIPLTMAFGFAAACVGLFVPALALPAGYAAYGLLSYVIVVGEAFGSLPWGAVDVSRVSIGVVLCAYALLLWFLFRRNFDRLQDNR